jgi:hypothetical protein
LVRAYGRRSTDWIDKTIELFIDTYLDRNAGVEKELVKVRPISPPVENKASPPPKKCKCTGDDDDFGANPDRTSDRDDKIPY